MDEDIEAPVGPAGLEHEDAGSRIGAEAIGQHAAGRSAADDDVVEPLAAHAWMVRGSLHCAFADATRCITMEGSDTRRVLGCCMPFRLEDLDTETRAGLMALGETMARLRTARGSSQRLLSRRSGVSQSSISRLEAGKAPWLRARHVARLLTALGVSAAALDFTAASDVTDAPSRIRPRDPILEMADRAGQVGPPARPGDRDHPPSGATANWTANCLHQMTMLAGAFGVVPAGRSMLKLPSVALSLPTSSAPSAYPAGSDET